MVVSISRFRKAIAVLLVLSIVAGCSYAGLIVVKKRLYPRGYSDYVEKYCRMYGVDDNLAYAVIHTESRFDSNAVSSLGACGLMQLMPETFEWLRSKKPGGVIPGDDIFDPETNISCGIYFLSLLYERFGSEQLIVAAYHAGMGRVSSWLKDSTLSSDGKTLGTIPYPDTDYYVKKVERTKRIYEALY